jgi:exopolysaccharide production protein ExoQ
MNKELHYHVANGWIWIPAFILANFRGTVIWDVLKQGFHLTILPWVEVSVWIILLGLAFWVLRRESRLGEYLRLWRKNWFLLIFILVGLLSIFWSVSASATLYRAAALLFSSIMGAYLGTRYSAEDALMLFFQFGTILLILCFVLALFLPLVGRMDWEPYNGAWRGIFWHKNQFGGLAAFFNMGFLILALRDARMQKGRFALYVVFYLFSLVVIFFSESVAGYLLCIIMGCCVIAAFSWIKVRHRLSRTHYHVGIAVGMLIVLLLFLNLDSVFGLFNRNTTLTGRIPLWIYLLQDVFSESPWLGHGFGALWSMTSFRLATSEAVNWGLPVAIGDNGFLDILLHVGLIGFIPFLAVLLVLFIRSARFALRSPTITGFFPLLFAIYMVVANISFSFFLETETFLWLVLVAMLFITTRDPQPTSAS